MNTQETILAKKPMLYYLRFHKTASSNAGTQNLDFEVKGSPGMETAEQWT